VPNTDFVAIAAGEGHSLGLKADGSIVAWGANWEGQCNVPAPNADFVSLASGRSHSLGLKGLFGDVNVDDRVDLADFDVFIDCLAGPALLPPRGCAATRMDGDWNVDLADFAILQRGFSPPRGR
jgi:hypothetical protein